MSQEEVDAWEVDAWVLALVARRLRITVVEAADLPLDLVLAVALTR